MSAAAVPSGVAALDLDLATELAEALTDAELVDGIVGYERIAAWAAARQHALLAEFAGRPDAGPASGQARPWAGDEIALALTVSPGSAALRVARAVRLAGPLRATRDLLEAGSLDASRARLVADRTAALDEATAAAVQHRVLPRAPEQTWGQLDRALRRAVVALDPDGAEGRHRRARAERRVDVYPGDDGMATIWARITAPDAAASHEWITRLARGMDTDGDPSGDPRGIDARRADVLVALLTGRLVAHRAGQADAPAVRPVGADRPLVQVTVALSTLAGDDDEPGELDGHGPIPAHLARVIALDARAAWKRLLTDPESGVVLDVGRTAYRPPAALADLVRARDTTCRNPRCPRAARACELDHVVEWQDGGTTSEDNLCALCVRHHDLKERPGWQVVLHPDRTVEWTTPTGHHYRSRPHDHRVPASRARGWEDGAASP